MSIPFTLTNSDYNLCFCFLIIPSPFDFTQVSTSITSLRLLGTLPKTKDQIQWVLFTFHLLISVSFNIVDHCSILGERAGTMSAVLLGSLGSPSLPCCPGPLLLCPTLRTIISGFFLDSFFLFLPFLPTYLCCLILCINLTSLCRCSTFR